MPNTLPPALQTPGDVLDRPIRIELVADAAIRPAVTEQDLVAVLQGVEPGIVDGVVAFAVGDWDAQRLSIRQTGCHGRHQRLGTQQHVAADELAALVVAEGPGKQARLAEDLEAIAHTEDESAPARVGHHLIHDGRETRDGSTAEIVSVAEATGQDHQVDPLEVAVLVPEPLDVEPEFRAEGVFHVVVAIGPGEGDDADFHAGEVRNLRPDSTCHAPSLLSTGLLAFPTDEGDHRRQVSGRQAKGPRDRPTGAGPSARQIEDFHGEGLRRMVNGPAACNAAKGRCPEDTLSPTLLTTSTVTTIW